VRSRPRALDAQVIEQLFTETSVPAGHSMTVTALNGERARDLSATHTTCSVRFVLSRRRPIPSTARPPTGEHPTDRSRVTAQRPRDLTHTTTTGAQAQDLFTLDTREITARDRDRRNRVHPTSFPKRPLRVSERNTGNPGGFLDH
jgi:hypothetical protein